MHEFHLRGNLYNEIRDCNNVLLSASVEKRKKERGVHCIVLCSRYKFNSASISIKEEASFETRHLAFYGSKLKIEGNFRIRAKFEG